MRVVWVMWVWCRWLPWEVRTKAGEYPSLDSVLLTAAEATTRSSAGMGRKKYHAPSSAPVITCAPRHGQWKWGVGEGGTTSAPPSHESKGVPSTLTHRDLHQQALHEQVSQQQQ